MRKKKRSLTARNGAKWKTGKRRALGEIWKVDSTRRGEMGRRWKVSQKVRHTHANAARYLGERENIATGS